MFYLLKSLQIGRDPMYTLRYRWLEYTDADGGPEKVCNCSAILKGDIEALEQTKILKITKDFQKRINIPNEYYINATQDCTCVHLKYRFLVIVELLL